MEDIKEKTADEMFEELGYEKSEHKNCIRYRDEDYEIILWRINEPKVEAYDSISMQELQAINKKCLELRLVRR